MKQIINAIEKSVLKKELKKIKFVRKTARGGNEIYSFCNQDSPILMDEVGRLREITFRDGGGGTGKEKDVDKYDVSPKPFNQLLLWDPDGEEVMGGYRFQIGKNIENDESGVPFSPTSKLFKFSEKFIKDFWPGTMELGRSFVQPNYQPSINRKKGIYALDNLWDGLGSLVVDYPEMNYFFGKMTMFPQYNADAKRLILHFLEKHFPDKDNLVIPKFPIEFNDDKLDLKAILDKETYKEDYKILNTEVRARKEFIPPLFTAYMNLSHTMRYFKTSVNKSFGDVEETGIMITIKDIFPEKLDRYIKSYQPAG
jgi:hypothetical protein